MVQLSGPPIRPPALIEATKNSTATWQDELASLFRNAKTRFPDVAWELLDDDGPPDAEPEEVWGHKAIVYSRAPQSFQARYFSFRPPPPASPMPYSTSPNGSIRAQSQISLTLPVDYPESMRSGSPFRVASPSPSNNPGQLLRIPMTVNPGLFSNELEYLYTGKGIAFEFLFDSNEPREEGDEEVNRIDKLRKDLVFMWRSRLYSDVRLQLMGEMASTHDGMTAVFSSHRFILASRSPYFHSQFITYAGAKPSVSPSHVVELPSPPFTPASLHFTLGFIYTGTLIFSNRSFDLDTAFYIMRSATYLSLQTLYDETQARIVQEMMHGLFHAFLEFSEYERITGGKWGTGGCRCRQCARRAPRVLEFAVSPDVRNPHLERGARRALVGLFGEGWCTPEFATLPQKTKDGLLKGLAKRTIPMNIFPLLFAAQFAMNKLNGVMEAWADTTREMVLAARKTIDDTLCAQAEACFTQQEWVELMEGDAVRFEDGEKVEWVMDAIRRGLGEKNAGVVYQTLVSSILLRPHPTETGETLLSSTSHIRVQVEDTRVDILRWLRKRWVGVRQEGGFDTLEGWAVKELSHELDVPVEDLIGPPPAAGAGSSPNRNNVTRSQSNSRHSTATSKQDQDGEASLRASVLNRNMARHNGPDTTNNRDRVMSSASSIRSGVSISTTSSRLTADAGYNYSRDRNGHGHSRDTTVTLSSARKKAADIDPRPDSKLSPSHSVVSSSTSYRSTDQSSLSGSILAKAPGGPNGTSPRKERDLKKTSEDVLRPKSSASVMSVRSQSTLRKTSAGNSSSSKADGNPGSSLRPHGPSPNTPASRPGSSVSSRSEASSTFKTAPESARTRRLSSASTVSVRSINNRDNSSPTANKTKTRTAAKPPVPIPPIPTTSNAPARPRRSSTASTKSVSSTLTAPKLVKKSASDNTGVTSGSTLGPVARRSPSSTSMRSVSSASAANRKSTASLASTTTATTTRRNGNGTSTSSADRSSIAKSVSQDSTVTTTTKSSGSGKRTKEKEPADGAITLDRSGDTLTVKPTKPRASGLISVESSASGSSKTSKGKSDGGSTPKGTGSLRKKGSSDTITISSKSVTSATPTASTTATTSIVFSLNGTRGVISDAIPPDQTESTQSLPRGATLDIGIPCIISSKRKRFRAFARYIGEVEGENGPWVGVEVPLGEGWADEKQLPDGPQWNDGTWGGIRYFELGSSSEWDDDDRDRLPRGRGSSSTGYTHSGMGGSRFAPRQRRGDWVNGLKGSKREGDQLNVAERGAKRMRSSSPIVSDFSSSECRGLFVRPQQVLYVVDAIGPDI